jgi:poly(3-hydroxybutyrate) depolymerase
MPPTTLHLLSFSRDVLHMRIGKSLCLSFTPHWLTTPADYRYPYLLASHGFLVLCPNYRGSQGRGSSFARASNGGMGTLDYADVESMLAASIERGYTDRDKVAIAGYSQGGFLSAWGCARPGAIWKAGVLGAAPTDWGSMIICNDLPHMAVRTSFISRALSILILAPRRNLRVARLGLEASDGTFKVAPCTT